MEVMIPTHEMDFDFNSARSTPYPSAPSTPRGFGDYYCSAPSSPSRLSEFYREFDGFMISESMESGYGSKHGDDFEFDIGEEVNSGSVSAEELFDGGVIRPLKNQNPFSDSGNSSDQRKKGVSSRIRSPERIMIKKENNPFGTEKSETQKGRKMAAGPERGRERTLNLSSSSRRGARSLSPLRVSQDPWEEEQERLQNQKQSSICAKSSTSSGSSSVLTTSSSKGSRKWRLRDFFLFRSASEGRASDKDPLKKYTASFRTADSAASGSNSRRRVSAHELHYTANRAAKEEMKKKTSLPYKSGILGRLTFNPAIGMANGFPVYKY